VDKLASKLGGSKSKSWLTLERPSVGLARETFWRVCPAIMGTRFYLSSTLLHYSVLNWTEVGRTIRPIGPKFLSKWFNWN
jgi:hypothetical protein